MKWLLKVREEIVRFYGKYNRYVDGLCKFVLALCAFLTIFYYTGYNARISNPFFGTALAAICAFTPPSFITVFAAGLLVIEFAAVSLELMVITLVFFVMMLLMYFVFKAQRSFIMILALLACLWQISPALLPLALLISPVEILTVVFGVLLYGLVTVVRQDASLISSGSSLTLGGRVNLILSDLFLNEKLLLLFVSLVLALLVIVIIRRSKINYSAIVAMVSGTLLYLTTLILGAFYLEIRLNVVMLLVGVVICALVSVGVLLFNMNLDYRRTEQVQFEDDEYYYYVKAVPKVHISVQEKKIENITKSPTAELPEINTDKVFIRKEERSGKEKEE